MTNASDESKDERAEDPVVTWERRADAYTALVRRHALFTELADGVVARVVAPELARVRAAGARSVLDVGAGGGLCSERFVRAGGDARGLLAAEPAPAMRRHLVATLARIGAPTGAALETRAEDLGERFGAPPLLVPVDAAMANAVWHLLDAPRTFAALARAVVPEGRLVFSLWWHALADDAPRHSPEAHWRPALARALYEHDEPPALARPKRELPRPERSLAELVALAHTHSFDFVAAERHERDVDGDFFVDVAAQDHTFLAEVPEPRRAAVLARARELAPRCTVGWRVCEFTRR
jgi:SAM-dependent methyltransferase